METNKKENLSVAWAKAFCKVVSNKKEKISPLIVKITGFSERGIVYENEKIRNLLSHELSSKGKWSLETTSETIFPNSLWNRNMGREELFKLYLDIWPFVKKEQLNKRGTYFYRMINFENGEDPVNQLEHVITTWNNKNNKRRSALQAAIFDPRKDHVHRPRLGFPCLQQVAFNPLGANGKEGLSVIGFYPTQLLFDRGYGNYLGLCRLGEFMAQEMNLELKQMICVVTSAKISDSKTMTITESRNFADKLKKILNDQGHDEIE
jgi:thymidylate synthase